MGLLTGSGSSSASQPSSGGNGKLGGSGIGSSPALQYYQPSQMYADGTQGYGFSGQQQSPMMQQAAPQQNQAWGADAQPWQYSGYQPMNTQNTPNSSWTMDQVNQYNNTQTTPGTLGNGVDYYHLPSPDQIGQYNTQDQQAKAYQPPSTQQQTASPQISAPSAYTLPQQYGPQQQPQGGLNSLGGNPVQQGANPIAQRDQAYANSIGDTQGGWW